MMETEQVFGMWIFNWVVAWLITWEDISECDIYYGFCLQGMSKETAVTEADINAAAEAWQNGAARRPKPRPQVSPVWVIHFHFPHFLFLISYFYSWITVNAYLFKHYHLFCYTCMWISVAWYFVIAWSCVIIVGWQFKLKCFNFHFADLCEIWSYSTD